MILNIVSAVFLQVPIPTPDLVVEKYWSIDPTNVFGALVVALILVILYMGWLLWRKDNKIDSKDEEIKGLNKSKDEEVKALNKQIQDSDKESMEVIRTFVKQMEDLERAFNGLKDAIYLGKINQNNNIPTNQFQQ